MNSLTSAEAWRATVAEFVATFTFVALGVGSVGVALSTGNGLTVAGVVAIAIGHGLAIALGVAAVGRISGAHMNPAVSVAFFVTGNIALARALMFIAAQLVGAVLAAGLARWIFDIPNVGVHSLNMDILSSPGQGFAFEIVLTFFLVFTVFAVAVDRRGNATVAPLAIGGVILLDHLAAIPVTGASMNPARSFGPALVWSAWADHWVYWLGPIIGGMVAGIVYTWVFGDRGARAAARSLKLDDPAKAEGG